MFVVHTSNCDGENCTSRAIFRLGIDTLITNILVIIIVCSRRRRTRSRHSSRLDEASRRTQAKLSVSNFYDVYEAIDVPYSPGSEYLPPTPTSIIKHSELLNALPPSEYVPMQVRYPSQHPLRLIRQHCVSAQR